MKVELEQKCQLMADNYVVVHSSGKLDFNEAAALGALLHTAADKRANEDTIRACRKLLKERVGLFSNFRGAATNLGVLCKMAMADDPVAYIDRVFEAYDYLTAGKIFRSEYLAFAAMVIADNAEPDQFEQIAEKTKALMNTMSLYHPLLTDSGDTAMAALLVMSGLDVEKMLDDAEAIFEALKGEGFLFNKDALQAASQIMALSPGSNQEKIQRFGVVRQAMADAGVKLRGPELALVGALAGVDMPVQQMVDEIAQADEFLKAQKGFHGILGCGSQMRRMFACALELQVIEKEKASRVATASNTVTSVIVEQIIITVILILILVAASSSASSSSN